MTPAPWARLNAVHAVLGALAAMSGRSLAMPALNCTGVHGGNIPTAAERLSSRCFWHVPSADGVVCVLRIGGCEEPPLATPAEVSAARRSSSAPPPHVTLDLSSPLSESALEGFARAAARPEALMLVSLRLPSGASAGGVQGGHGRGKRRDPASQEVVDAVAENVAAQPALARQLRAFRLRCSDLTRRSKRGDAECNNICS